MGSNRNRARASSTHSLCFNPCFSGLWVRTKTSYRNIKKEPDFVSILVLVDYGFEPVTTQNNEQTKQRVSILVLMDYGFERSV